MSLAAVVADDLVNLDDDILWNLGINGFGINHLGKGDAFVVVLSDLAEYFKAMMSAGMMIDAM